MRRIAFVTLHCPTRTEDLSALLADSALRPRTLRRRFAEAWTA